jgi:hypothetical protein
MFEYPCGQRLAPILQHEVSRLSRLGELRYTDEDAGELAAISASAMDRLVARERQVRHLKRERDPSVKMASEWDTHEMGNPQVDCVAAT